MLKKLLNLFLITSITLLIQGCEIHSDHGLVPVIAQETRISDDETAKAIEVVNLGKKEITFSKETEFLKDVKEGNILVIPITPQTPDGMLIKVTGIERLSGGKVKISYKRAALAEAVVQGQLKASDIEIKPSDIDAVIVYHGSEAYISTLQSANQPITALAPDGSYIEALGSDELFTFKMSGTLGNDYANVKGTISLSLSFDFDLQIEDFSVKRLYVVGKTKSSKEVVAIAKAGLKREYNRQLGEVLFKPKVFYIGVLPVYIRPALQFYVGTGGEVKSEVRTSLKQTNKSSVGVEYDGAKWNPIRESSESLAFEQPVLEPIDAALKGFIGTRLVFYVYGVVGPYASVEGFLKLTANPLKDPWCKLSAGISALAGAKVEIFDKALIDAHFKLFTDEEPLYECTGKTAPFMLVTPLDSLSTYGSPYQSFRPQYKIFTIRSTKGQIGFRIDENADWLDVDRTSGTVDRNNPVTVTFTVNQNVAKSLPPGTKTYAKVCFVNTTNDRGTHCRTFSLTVAPEVSIVYDSTPFNIREGESPRKFPNTGGGLIL